MLALSFVELGEGLSEDYNPGDPEDVELLRIDAQEVEPPYDIVYTFCTLLPVSMSARERQAALKIIGIGLDAMPGFENTLLQRITWAENLRQLKDIVRSVGVDYRLFRHLFPNAPQED